MNNSHWIYADGAQLTAPPRFYKTWHVKKALRRATAKVSAVGVYHLTVNGQEPDGTVLAPGWTSAARNLYMTHDITACLTEGENTVSLSVGPGWKHGEVGRHFLHRKEEAPGEHVSVTAEISLVYTDGEKEVFHTDETWQAETTAVTFADIYQGETYDGTAPVRSLGHARRDTGITVPCLPSPGVPVKEHERVAVCRLIHTPAGECVLDFGQNLAGYTEIRYRGQRGDRIRLSFAEVLDKNGNFYNANYRDAKNDILYILDGKREIYKPMFTFQGYRYVRIDEFPGKVNPEDFTSVTVYSDIRRIGDFHCGNEKINALYSNILYGQRSNFVDVPTDCPQRDERLGWTGDAQVFCRTAAINYDVKAFFAKWLGDMALEQRADGAVPHVVPNVLTDVASAAWGDAAVICPFEIYLAYGDKKLLKKQYPMMKKWVEYMHGAGPEEYLWIGGNHFDDWLAMDAGYGSYVGATQGDLIASAFFAYSTELCVRAGRILGEDTTALEGLYTNVRAAFRRAFMKDGLPVLYPYGEYENEERRKHLLPVTQTAIVLILRFGLCEETERPLLADTLSRMIRDNGGRMTTGFVGTPYILHALSGSGKTAEAYDLLLQEQAPSWLFSVNHGATTVWEHWDSVNENGDFWSTDMNSFNHYAYGSVFDWIYGAAAGITVPDDGAGYTKVRIAPHPDRRLGHLSVTEETPHGRLHVAWYCREKETRFEITVPNGTAAELTLPGKNTVTLSGGAYLFCLPAE